MLEVERKFMLSNSNQTYSFPRLANKLVTHEDCPSEDSVDGITVYNLHEQNLRNYEKERLSFEISAGKGRENYRIENQQEIFQQQQFQQQQLEFDQNLMECAHPQQAVASQMQYDAHPQAPLFFQAVDNHNNAISAKFEQNSLNPNNVVLNPCFQELVQQQQNLEQQQSKPSQNYSQCPQLTNQQTNDFVNSQNSTTKLQFQQFSSANKNNLIFCDSPKIKMHIHTSSDVLPNSSNKGNENQVNNMKNNRNNHNAYQMHNGASSHNMSKSINTYGSNQYDTRVQQPPTQLVQRSQQLTQTQKLQMLSEDQGRAGKKTQGENQQGQEKQKQQDFQQQTVQSRQPSETTNKVVQTMSSKKKMEQQQQYHVQRNSNARCDSNSLNSRKPTEDDRHKSSSKQQQQHQQQHPRNNGLALSVNINLNLAVAKKTHIQQYTNHLPTAADGQVVSSSEDRLSGVRGKVQNTKLSNSNTKISHKNNNNNNYNNTTATRSTADTNSRRMKTEGNEYGMAELLIQKSQLKTQNYNGCARTFSEPAEQIFDDGQQLEDTIENFESALQDGQDSEEGEIAVLEGYQPMQDRKIATAGDLQHVGLNFNGNNNNKSSNSSKRIKQDSTFNKGSADIIHQGSSKQPQRLGQQEFQQPQVQGVKNLNPTIQSLVASRLPTDPDRNNILKQNSRFQTEIACPIQSSIPQSGLQTEIINNHNYPSSSSRIQSKNKVSLESSVHPSQSITNQLEPHGFLQQQRAAANNSNNGIPNLHQLKNSLMGHLPSYKQITNKTGQQQQQYHSKASSQQYYPAGVVANHVGAAAGLINKKQQHEEQIYGKSATNQIIIDDNIHKLLICAANSIQSKGINGQLEQPAQGNNNNIKQHLDINNDNSRQKSLKTLENDFNPQPNQEKIPQFNNLNVQQQQYPVGTLSRQPKPRTASSFHHLSSHKTESTMTPKKSIAPFHLNNFTFMQPQQHSSQMSAEFAKGSHPPQLQQQPIPYSIGATGDQVNNANMGQSSLQSSQGINSSSKRNLLYNNSSSSHLIGNGLRHHNAPQFASIKLSQTKLPVQLHSETRDNIMPLAQQKQDQQEQQLQKQSNLQYSSNELSHQDYQLLNTESNPNKAHIHPFAPGISAVALSLKKPTSNHKDSSHSHSARRTKTLSSKPSGSESTNSNNLIVFQQQQHASKTNARDTNTVKSRISTKTEETNTLSKDTGIHQQSETLPICRATSKGHAQMEQHHSTDLDCRVINNKNKNILPGGGGNNHYNSSSSMDKQQQQVNNSRIPQNLINNNNSNNNVLDQKGGQKYHSKAYTNEHPISQQHLNQVYQPYISITNSQSFEKVREFLHQKKHVKAASSLQYQTTQIKNQTNNNNNTNNYNVNDKQMLSVVQQQQQQQVSQQQQQYSGQFASSSTSAQQQYFPKQMR